MKLLGPIQMDRREKINSELCAVKVNGRTELLPADPFSIAKVLRDRRLKTPAARAKARIDASLKQRGIFNG